MRSVILCFFVLSVNPQRLRKTILPSERAPSANPVKTPFSCQVGILAKGCAVFLAQSAPSHQTYSKAKGSSASTITYKSLHRNSAPWCKLDQSSDSFGVPVLVCLDSLLMPLQNFGIKTQLFWRGTAKAHHRQRCAHCIDKCGPCLIALLVFNSSCAYGLAKDPSRGM